MYNNAQVIASPFDLASPINGNNAFSIGQTHVHRNTPTFPQAASFLGQGHHIRHVHTRARNFEFGIQRQ